MSERDALEDAARGIVSGAYVPKGLQRNTPRWLIALPGISSEGLAATSDLVAALQARRPVFRPIFLVPSRCHTRPLSRHGFQYETLLSAAEIRDILGLDPTTYLRDRLDELARTFVTERVLVDAGDDGAQVASVLDPQLPDGSTERSQPPSQ